MNQNIHVSKHSLLKKIGDRTAPSIVRQKHFDCPLVAGRSVGHKLIPLNDTDGPNYKLKENIK